MDLTDNPFYVLRVGARHGREDIVEAAEARALTDDGQDYVKARSILTHPRNRVLAELNWLPGVDDRQALQLVDQVRSAPKEASTHLAKLTPLARCNLTAMLMSRHKVAPERQARWMQFLARSYEEVNKQDLLNQINVDRAEAGFAQLPSIDGMEAGLADNHAQLAEVMRRLLDKSPAPDELMVRLMEDTTGMGRRAPPNLIEELTYKYQIEVQKYLDQVADQIRTVLDTVRAAPYVALDQKMALVEEKLTVWGTIARPVQLLMQSKGLDDQASIQLANEIRDILLFLANENQLHEEALRMSRLMALLFKQLPMFSQSINEDIKALGDILERKRNRGVDQKWAKEIELDIVLGKLSKDRLTINAEAITYKGESIPLEEVDRVRWGTFVQYVNGIKSSTSHLVCIGSHRKHFKIECSRNLVGGATNEENFKLIIDKLWTAVCVRLFNQTLTRIANGEKIRYGTIVVSLEGILLEKKNFITIEPYLAPWEDLRIGNAAGSFVIESDREKSAKTQLAYRDVENVHILEALMRFLWKDGNLAKLKSGQFK